MARRKLTKDYLLAYLVKTRLSANLTQKDLAERLGKPQSFVSKYETGERNLDFLEVISILEAMGTDPADEIKRLIS